MSASTRSPAASDPPVFRIDTHVHLHPIFPLAATLDAAWHNMGGADPAVLMLTEMPDVDRFADLTGSVGTWQFTPSDEACSVWGRAATGERLLVIAGHQVVTAEGLEVLMLGACTPIAAGLTIDTSLAAIVAEDAIAVLPWGVGKWTGARGRLIADLASKPPPNPHIYVADSGVRRRGSPRPAHLARAEASGWHVLAGTDPLSFANQAASVGRYGNILHGAIDLNRPFARIKSLLADLKTSPEIYGTLQSTPGFLAMQIAMQVRKRLG